MEDSAPSPFVRSGRHHGGSGGGPSRWSFGRCSVRGLATLLRRGKPHHPQKQLASLSNNLDVGNHCATRNGSRDLKAAPAPSEFNAERPRIRTTVLGCPRKLRDSMPVRLPPPPPPPPLLMSLTAGAHLEGPSAAAAASPLFQVRRHPTRQQQQQQQQHQPHQPHQRLPQCHKTLESIPDDEDTPPPGSRRWKIPSLGGDPCGAVCSWNDCRCSCGCTCQSASSQRRIERLEAEVTSLSRRFVVPATTTATTEAAATSQNVGVEDQQHRRDLRDRRLRDLRDECRQLREDRDAMRRDHERRISETRQMMRDLACDVRRILGSVASASAASASAESPPESSESSDRRLIEAELQAYQLERAEVSALIADIDETTGELRHDVLRHRCRSNPAEVELLALHLSRATQRLAQLKNRFPDVQTRTRDLLRREALAAAADERLLAEEEGRLDAWLRQVKKLTMMLYTFKQLADAQAKEPPSLVPILVPDSSAEEACEARRDLLRGVLSVCPDHERRALAIERAEAVVKRRRRMLQEATVLKAEKTLTAAANRLKPVLRDQRGGSNVPKSTDNSGDV